MKLSSVLLGAAANVALVLGAPANSAKRDTTSSSALEGSLIDSGTVFTAEVLTAYNSSSNLTVLIGNDKFTMEMGPTFGKKLLWKPTPEENAVDLVGNAVGLYASYSGALHDLSYHNVHVVENSSNKLDISFDAPEGEHHIVMFKGLNGFYSYFVNKALPVLGEFRTLIRLNPELYQSGYTSLKSGVLPKWPDDFSGNKTFDETWLNANSDGYITKYDWSSRLHEDEIYGVYGTDEQTNQTYGFWLISAGRDYFCGDQLKQELSIHRESSTGDVVLLNMLHGTHFEVELGEAFPEDKVWGPFLYYFNDGDLSDARRRWIKERGNWPYKWFHDQEYLSRGTVKGRLVVSDGSAASNVNLFLGETNNYTMVQGAGYQYYGYTDDDGYFEIEKVRTGQQYWLQAFSSEWSSAIDVVGNYTYSKPIRVEKDQTLDLGKIKWSTDHHKTIWGIGNYDRTTKGFLHGAKKYENFQTEYCPADYEFYVGETSFRDWCYAKSKKGTWSIHFNLDVLEDDKKAVLYLSIAGYTGNNSYVGGDSTKLKILVNGQKIENDEYDTQLYNDKSTYRSSSFGGNWYYSKLPIPNSYLALGNNTVSLVTEEYTPNYGIMWDSLKLVWE